MIEYVAHDEYDRRMLKVEFIISTKTVLINEKVNKWIEDHHDDIDILKITPFMSYTSIDDKGAMQIGCMIEYLVRETNTQHYEEQ